MNRLVLTLAVAATVIGCGQGRRQVAAHRTYGRVQRSTVTQPRAVVVASSKPRQISGAQAKAIDRQPDTNAVTAAIVPPSPEENASVADGGVKVVSHLPKPEKQDPPAKLTEEQANESTVVDSETVPPLAAPVPPSPEPKKTDHEAAKPPVAKETPSLPSRRYNIYGPQN